MFAISTLGRRHVFPAAQYLQLVGRGRCVALQGPPRAFLALSHFSVKNTVLSTSTNFSVYFAPRRTFSTTLTLPRSSYTTTLEEGKLCYKLDFAKLNFRKRDRRVYEVLQNGQPDQILMVLAHRANKKVVASLPDSVFVSAFLRLTPEYFIEPFLRILQPVHHNQLLNKDLNKFDEILIKFLKLLDKILLARRGRGDNAVGFIEYRHLLRISASVGDLSTTRELWEGMKQFGMQPDLQCYNSLLHAYVWENAVYGPPRYRVRVTPFNYRSRGVSEPDRKFRGYGTAARSVRKQVYSIILEMEEAGLPLNEDTYINMLLASARVGSSSGMDQVLQSIWGVNVDSIANTPPEHLPAAKRLDASSPVYPSRKLLLAVAHAYGCNSMFEKALKTVQYISDQFGIEITDDVWAELVERAFVLSRKRYGKEAPRLLRGKIHGDTLLELKTMLQLDGKPYDMNVYRMLAKSACDRTWYDEYHETIREAYTLLCKTRRKRNHALSILENYLGVSLRMQPSSFFSSSSPIDRDQISENCSTPHVWRALHKYELLRLLVEQQQSLMEKMAGYAVINQKRWTGPKELDWTRQLLPRFLAEWKDFLPEAYTVQLPTTIGAIEFIGRTQFKEANLRVHENEPVRWSECGSEIVAEENDAIEVGHDVLWARFKARFDDLVMLQPLHWFISKAWRRAPVLVQKVIGMADEFGDEIKHKIVDEFEHVVVDDFEHAYEGEDVEESLAWQWQQRRALFDHQGIKHAHYVTMEPLFVRVSL
jgi:Mitochondrial ATPase expression/Pentatricopeptide repeat domain